jgi:hypothetical protein
MYSAADRQVDTTRHHFHHLPRIAL